MTSSYRPTDGDPDTFQSPLHGRDGTFCMSCDRRHTPRSSSAMGDSDIQDEQIARIGSLRRLQQLFDRTVNVEDLIGQVEKHPCIWNTAQESYSNKNEKLKSWTAIITVFVDNFNEMSQQEKDTMVKIILRRWKSIRAGYSKEILRRKTDYKYGKGSKPPRKQYVYFEQLRFLETQTKKTESSISDNDEGVIDMRPEDNHFEQEHNAQKIANDRNKSKKRGKKDDVKLVEPLKKKVISDSEQDRLYNVDADEDKLFLLSLLSEVKKVPPERKLKLKADFISILAAAQTPAPPGEQWAPFPYHTSALGYPNIKYLLGNLSHTQLQQPSFNTQHIDTFDQNSSHCSTATEPNPLPQQALSFKSQFVKTSSLNTPDRSTVNLEPVSTKNLPTNSNHTRAIKKRKIQQPQRLISQPNNTTTNSDSSAKSPCGSESSSSNDMSW